MAWLRWDAIVRSLEEIAPSGVIEIGAGQGAMGTRIAERCSYVGLEPDPVSANVARARIDPLGTLLEGSIELLDAGARVDLLCAFEVLEHIEDDAAALSTWREHLVDEGSLLLSVPAHPERFGPSDRLVGHFRRYSREDLERVLASTGFRVVRIEPYGTGVGHLLEWVRNRIIERRGESPGTVGTTGSGRLYQPRLLLGAVTWAVAAPGRLLQRMLGRRAPGVGWIVQARRTR